mgnify:FL=1
MGPPEERPPRALAGGPQELFDTHFSFVWRNLRRLGLDEHAAEDATQDVFLVVHRRWDSFDARWSSIETWLFGILLRVARTHRRTWFRYERWLDRSHTTDEALRWTNSRDPEQDASVRERLCQLETLLQKLSPKERELFAMVDIEQFSVAQAAEALGVNVNTAYTRLRQARSKVQHLSPLEGAPPESTPTPRPAVGDRS